ncbi:MAG TPA: NAD(P)H-dependent oxidoreductase [Gammaproteobacteria bacterium]|nr:NAD(P)H-dependent oxidoreductase [Gammaproteobacteria bacterium]
MKRIAILQGHPDASNPHLCHALAEAYGAGAENAGHDVKRIPIAELSFPLIRSRRDFEHGERPACIREAQTIIQRSAHLLLVYPLWLGTMPALFKGFLEQVFRYDFAFEQKPDGRFEKKLKGRSARVVITMGMPAMAYRWYFRAHSLKSLERNILKFAGISPVRESLFGLVEDADEKKRARWLDKMRALGAAGR